jgi:predicted RNA methylase/superfamily II DNA/RNA helicase
MLIILRKSQLALFDAPVHVSGTVDKHGHLRAPHIRIQKVKPKAPPAPVESSIKVETPSTDLFAQVHEAPPEVVEHKPTQEISREISQEKPRENSPGEIVEHVTKRRTLRGMIRRDLSEGEAKGIDPYTFKKDGGWFIREKHLNAATPAPAATEEPAPKKLAKRVKSLHQQWEEAADEVNRAIREQRPDDEAERLRDIRDDLRERMRAAPEETNPERAPVAARESVGIPQALRKQAAGLDYSQPFESITVPSFGVTAGTSKAERKRLNAQAVALLDKSGHTDPERAILAKYSGNGGVGDSLNEFYTLPAVAAAMWKTLHNLGIEKGEVLEPSSATGVFLATATAGVRVTGVELDPTSAKIANILHAGRHEIRNASLERFATSDERQFDAVIGNVPFGLRGSLIKDDKPDLKTAEQYFLDTSLDKTKAGGIVALIVPTGVMDSKNGRSFREQMLRKSEFLGAQRMPNTAFEAAHTGVTTDIVYLRKRPDDVAAALGTVDQETLQSLGVWDDEFLGGGYFAGRGADNVFGTMEEGWRAKAGIGDDITVTGSMHGVPESIAAFAPHEAAPAPSMAEILAALPDEAARERAIGAAKTRPYAAMKVGDTKTVDGITYVLQGDPPRWHRVDEVVDTAMVEKATELAREIDALMKGTRGVHRQNLEADVRAFIEEHGIPVKNKDLLLAAKADPTLHRLIGAVSPAGRLSDVVTGKTRTTESTFDVTAHVLALESEGRSFTADELASRLGREPDEVADHLAADANYAYVGGDRWAPMSEYLTGELWPKLDAVKVLQQENPAMADKLATQERLLTQAIDPKSLEDVEIAMNSAFIPTEILSSYFNWKNHEAPGAYAWKKNDPPMAITFDSGVYAITGGSQHDNEQRLLDKYLNRTGVRKDDMPAIERMNADFKEWLTGSRYRDQVEDLYNRNFRGFKPVAFSDVPIDVPGLANKDKIKDYRWSGLRWDLAAGKGIIADDVGLGKTLGGLLLARMSKIENRAKRPMIVVPKSVLAKWASEAEMWFPGSKLLVLGATLSRDENGEMVGRDDGPAERERKLHDLTQNDYDFIICAESVYQEVDLSPELKEKYAGDEFWAQRGDALGNAGDKRRRKVREAFEQKVAGREFDKRTDAIYFDDLGVDMVIRDEGHREKNLWAARNRFGETPKFLGGQGESNRAYDFYLKSKYIRDQNGGRNVYMLTATPTKNSPLEVYSMLSHIAPEAFERIGIRNSEEFLDRFCVFENDRIYTLEGTFEDALVVSGFKNLNELREIMGRYIHRRTAEDVGLQLPKRDDRMHYLDMNSKQREVYAELRQRLADSKESDDATGDAHIFAIMSDMAKAAMDLGLYDPKTYSSDRSPKYLAVAKEAAQASKDGGQIIFAEYVGAHDRIADALVQQGVPRSEIAIVNAKVAPSASKRLNISDKFNTGKIKYVIGNATMSEGMDLQKQTSDIHHLDLPWEPASMQQRNGRGLRQGNTNEAVRIHIYASKGTFDGYRYQSMTRKKDWQDLLWHGGDRVENLLREGKVSHDDLAIMTADDPEAAAKKHAENKAAAGQRYDAEQRAAAASEFDRYQALKASHQALKNKETVSARRLQERISKARDQLAANKQFKAKAALDAPGPVLIHPATGDMLAEGQGFDVPQDVLKDAGRYVVATVYPSRGQISIRRYGVPDPHRFTVNLKAFSRAKPFDYDQAAETVEISKQVEAALEAKADSVKGPTDVRGMPDELVKKHYDTFQRQIKTAAREYKWNPNGTFGVVGKDGKAAFLPSYSSGKIPEGVDVLLPIADHREKALQAWIDAESGKQFKHDYVTKRRGSQPTQVLKQAYADENGGYYGGHTTNPWSSIGKDLFGPEFETEAREKFQRERFEAARRQDTFAGALKTLAPTINKDYGDVKWPRRALAILWARAKREGLLDKRLVEAAVHHDEQYGRSRPILPAEMYATRSYNNSSGSVHETIADLASTNNHHDLAAVIYAAKATDTESAKHAITKLMRVTGDSKWPAMRHLVNKFGLSDKSPSDLGMDQYVWGPTGGGYTRPLSETLDREEQRFAA